MSSLNPSLDFHLIQPPLPSMPRKKPHPKNSKRNQPSALLQQATRPKHHGAALRPLPRQSEGRSAIKDELILRYGLPSDCTIFFRRKKVYTPSDRPLILNHGRCVVIDADTLDLVLSINFNEYGTMPSGTLERYATSIPTFYQHAEARNAVGLNGSMQGVENPGVMKMFGWRPGCDAGRKAGSSFS